MWVLDAGDRSIKGWCPPASEAKEATDLDSFDSGSEHTLVERRVSVVKTGVESDVSLSPQGLRAVEKSSEVDIKTSQVFSYCRGLECC